RKMKYQKAFKGHFKARPHSLRATTLTIGNYGLRVTEGGRLKDKQLDQLRTIVRRALKEEKGAKFYFRVFTARPVSKKAAETRMGKGKGAVEYFASWVSRGRIVFEVKSTRRELALKALRIAAEALPLRTTVIE
ncbi:ribosomal protein L10e/L16, partial [Chytridium lagenaria]